jgi:hypothetical protein
MGKAARNERRKIAATYFNSVAVAFFVAGVAVPWFYSMSKTNREIADWFLAFNTADGFQRGLAGILTIISAGGLSYIFYMLARMRLGEIED